MEKLWDKPCWSDIAPARLINLLLYGFLLAKSNRIAEPGPATAVKNLSIRFPRIPKNGCREKRVESRSTIVPVELPKSYLTSYAPFARFAISLVGNLKRPASKDQGQHEQHQENKEENLCNPSRRPGDAAKTEQSSHQSDDQKRYCPTYHLYILLSLAPGTRIGDLFQAIHHLLVMKSATTINPDNKNIHWGFPH